MLELGVGTQLSDDYVIVEELTSEGLAARYIADSKSRSRTVELKVLNPEYLRHAEAVERFKREAELGRRLNAPNLVAVLDSGSLEDGRPFMALEHVEGERLDTYLERHQKLTPSLTVRFGLQAASALGYAHRAGVVHRDVAPRNMLVRETPTQLYVLNFDVARVAMSALTSDDQALGTPTYMAPEQIRASRAVDARADIWGLGIVLHELAAGRIPFDGQNLAGLVLSVLNDPPDLDQTLPKELTTIIRRCLEKDPARRYASMDQLSSALRMLLGPEARNPAPQLSAVPPMPMVSPVPVDAAYFVSERSAAATPAAVTAVGSGDAVSAKAAPTESFHAETDEPPHTVRLSEEAIRAANQRAALKRLGQTQVVRDVAPGFSANSPGVPAVAPGFGEPALVTGPSPAHKPQEPAAHAPPVVSTPHGSALRLSLFEFAMLCGELAVAPPERRPGVLHKYGLTEADRKDLLDAYRQRLAANPEEHAQWRAQYDSAVRHWTKLYGGT